MKLKVSIVFIAIVGILSLYWVLFSHFHFSNFKFVADSMPSTLPTNNIEFERLLNIIIQQNKTIHELYNHIEVVRNEHLEEKIKKIDLIEKPVYKPPTHVQELQLQDVIKSECSSISSRGHPNEENDPYAVFGLKRSEGDFSCDDRFGGELLRRWKESREVWCDGGESSITCYPYKQAHKGTKDMFCEVSQEGLVDVDLVDLVGF